MTARWIGTLLAVVLASCGTRDYQLGESADGSGTEGTSGGDLVDSSCSPACAATEICVADACECRVGLERCGDACVDTRSNPEHCGECGMACGPEVCSEGHCRESCEASMCGSICSKLEDDPFNCGACGNICAPDELCDENECVELTVPNCAVCPCEACGESTRCCEEVLESHPVACVASEDCP